MSELRILQLSQQFIREKSLAEDPLSRFVSGHPTLWKMMLAVLSLVALITVILSLELLAFRIFVPMPDKQVASDLFGAYDALRPENSDPALTGYQCDLSNPLISRDAPKRYLCYLHPRKGQILDITLVVRGNTIQRQTVLVRDVQVGDLALCWGRPNRIEGLVNSYSMHWDKEGLFAIVGGDNLFNYQDRMDTIQWVGPLNLSQTIADCLKHP